MTIEVSAPPVSRSIANWAGFLAFASAVAMYHSLGGNIVYHGPLGIWQISAILAALSLGPVWVAPRRVERVPDPEFKGLFGGVVTTLTDAVTLAMLLVATTLAAAWLMGDVRKHISAEVIAVQEDRYQGKGCNQYATLRVMSRETQVCIEGQFQRGDLRAGEVLHATVRTVPYGFLIDAVERVPAP